MILPDSEEARELREGMEKIVAELLSCQVVELTPANFRS